VSGSGGLRRTINHPLVASHVAVRALIGFDHPRVGTLEDFNRLVVPRNRLTRARYDAGRRLKPGSLARRDG
jgi:hypothetical protein